MLRYTHSILLIVFCLISCEETTVETSEMTPEKWKNDIENLISTLEQKHIHPYHSISKDSVQKQVKALLNDLTKLSDDEIFLRLSKIVKSLDDSHTGIWKSSSFYDALPIEFFVFNDHEVRVIRAPKEHPELIGAQLLGIENTPLQKVIKEVSSVAQCTDNWYSESERFVSYLKYSKVLKGLGITKQEDAASFEFSLEDNNKKTVTLHAIPNTEYHSSMTPPMTVKRPFSFDKAVIGTPYLWYQPMEELHTAYIYFAGYPELLQMRRFAIALSRELMKKGIENIIIDLRDNGGGNFFIGIELLKSLSFLDQVNWKNGVYAMTSRTTYSAGMSNTAQCKELLNAKIVGEPTGSNPNDFQDADGFQLPHSKIWVQYSKRHYQFQDSVSNGILPDVPIQPTWDALKNKVDLDLTWILEDIKQQRKMN